MILTSGVFDPLHAGHVSFLERAANDAGELVHVVVGDDLARHPPLVPLGQRAFVLAGLRWVRGVSCGFPLADEIRRLKPTWFVKGVDWAGRMFPSDVMDALREVGTGTRYLESPLMESSSELLADYQRRQNTEKLAALESWVSTQPEAKPWVPVTPYDLTSRRFAEGPHAQLIKDTFTPSSVLDVGCGPGHLLTMLEELHVPCKGIDVQAHGNWSTKCRIWQADITSMDSSPEWLTDLYDELRSELVICREVLEHIPCRLITATVQNLVQMSKRYVYVTTRFTAKPHLFDFDTADTLDPTHITLLNQDLLRALFVLEGCTRCPDLEASLDHNGQGRVLVYKVPS